MKKHLFFLFAALLCAGAFAQDLPKITVYVSGNLNANDKKALEARMLTSIFKSGRYRVVDRSEESTDKLATEHIKQRDGSVDEEQIKRLGKQYGVDFICIAYVNPAFGKLQVSVRILNVETAEVVFADNDSGQLRSMEDLPKALDKVFENMFGIQTATAPKPETAPAPAQPDAAQPAPIQQAAAQPEAVKQTITKTPAAQTNKSEPVPLINIPATSYWGVRGLSQTVSAEPLGAGRFNIAAFGSYFKQEQTIQMPEKGTNVYLGRIAVAWGMNNYTDFFLLSPMNYTDNTPFAVNGVAGGVQLAAPLPKEWPFKLAGQFQLVWGLSNKFTTFDTNYVYGYEIKRNEDGSYDSSSYDSYAGYDFFDTRGKTDVVVKVAESFVLFKGQGQRQRHAIKLHFNEGFSLKTKDMDLLLLVATGLEYDPLEFLTIGAELNWRTLFTSPKLSDPLWFTPSFMLRSPFILGFLGGADFNLSQKNNDKSTKPLEKWRVFGDIVVSFDFLAPKREADARRAKEEAQRNGIIE